MISNRNSDHGVVDEGIDQDGDIAGLEQETGMTEPSDFSLIRHFV